MLNIKNFLIGSAAGVLMLGATIAPAFANSTVVVTQTNTQGWSTADTRTGGAVNFIVDPTSPAPNGALQLTTDSTTTAKAQYLHAANTPLAGVTELSYYTKQVAPNGLVADPSYQLITYLTGTTGFTTLVYEPYQGGQGAITNNAWQQWNIGSGGLFWSTHTVTCSNGTVTGTSGGPAMYTLAQIQSMCPNALVAGYGVNIGTNNPGYNVETDLFDFNGTTYNFQVANIPSSKEQCKDNGYQNLTDANGNSFDNQGDCVSYVQSNSQAIGNKTK